MASIRGRDTRPELLLWHYLDRRLLRRYPRLPGSPDFGSKKRRVAVFVDGCFWHGCPDCYRAPATRPAYWRAKLEGNRERDREADERLRAMGYTVVRLWEHEVLKDPRGCAELVEEAVAHRCQGKKA
ncbi:MAG: DUF559 domain-containing protein [Nitrososphaerota archaeon]|jgi:DNA mismatch endonuclease (patch repair protein)|nr:DUF559 domain-containing protein [Nitrososphaerota archaeon]MDG7038985.1 DUF559 domain-containing protein [Nitrososphaerota archaeon]